MNFTKILITVGIKITIVMLIAKTLTVMVTRDWTEVVLVTIGTITFTTST